MKKRVKMISREVRCSACGTTIEGLRRSPRNPRQEILCDGCVVVKTSHPHVFAFMMRMVENRIEPLVRETMNEHMGCFGHDVRNDD